jgi:ABC-type arginine/histidine transport system permease subunit
MKTKQRIQEIKEAKAYGMDNLYVFSRHCCVVLPQHINDVIALIHNTMVVQDKISKDVVLVTIFTCFVDMKIEEYSFLKTLTKELKRISIHTNKIRNNGTH